MATNDRPRTSFEVTYGPLGIITESQGLLPVLIAPRYALHDHEFNEADCALLDATQNNKYVAGTAFTGNWPATAENSVIDLESAAVFIKDATVKYNSASLSGTVAAESLNKITFADTNIASLNGALDTNLNGIDVMVGDQIKVGDTIANVVAVLDTMGDAVIEDEGTPLDTASAAVTAPAITGDYNGTEDAAYMLKVLSVGTSTLQVQAVSILGDAGYSEIKEIGADAVSVGRYGCKVAFPSLSNMAVGMSWKFSVTAASAANRNIVQVDTVLTAGAVTVDFLTKRFTQGFTRLSTADVIVSAASVTVDDAITVALGNAICDITEGEVFVDFRELLTEDAMTVITSTSAFAKDWAGRASAQNPMGLMYAAVADIASNFYMISLTENTEAAYIQALNFAGQYEDLYALQPYMHTAEIRSTIREIVKHYADPEIAQFKYSWLPAMSEIETRLVSADPNEPKTALASITNGVAAFVQGDPINIGAKAGDTLCIQGAYNAATGTYAVKKYKVVEVSTETATLSGAVEDCSVAVAYFTRTASRREYAEMLAAEASDINERHYSLVWGDSLTLGDLGEVPLSVIAARLAAWRSALPPHAPMSTLTVPGVRSLNRYKFTDEEYSVMNAGGVWVLRPELDGTVTNYHQITTLTEGTIAEENSCVSAGDYIVRDLRNALKPYRSGSANRTNALLSEIEGVIHNRAAYLMSLEFEPKYGNLLLDYDIYELYFPQSNKAKLICKARFEIPQPTNLDQYTINLL